MSATLLTLAGHSAQYLSGRAAGIALGIVSFPIFTRVFSVAEYGVMSLVFQVANLAAVLAKLGLQNSVQRFQEQYLQSPEPAARRRYHSTMLLMVAAIAAAVTAAFASGVALLPASLLGDALRALLLLAGVLIFLRGLQSILLGFYRAERRTVAFNAIEVSIKAATISLTLFLLFFWDRSIRACLLAAIAVELAAAAGCLFLLFRARLVSLRCFDPALCRTAFLFALPLAGAEFAGVLLHSGDRILIQYFAGAEALGYYSAAFGMASYLAESLMYSAQYALIPLYMQVWVNQGEQETRLFLSRAMNGFAAVAFCLLGGAAAVAHDAITFLGSSKLAAAAPLLPVLVLALLVFAFHIFLNAGLLLHQRSFELAKLVAISAAANVALNCLLLPPLGAMGAALSLLASYILLITLLARASARIFPLRLDAPAWARYALAAAAGCALAHCLHATPALLGLLLRGTAFLLVFIAALLALDRPARLALARRAALFRIARSGA